MFALSLAPPFFSYFLCIFLRFTLLSVSSSSFLVRDAALISYLINRPGQNVTSFSGRCPCMILDFFRICVRSRACFYLMNV